jgi:phage recombination protein Bet
MTSTDIATTTAGTPAEWQSKLDLVKSMVAKGCTNDEFDLLCHLARTYHLDPLAREIWAIRYGQNPAQIFVGHAGLINLALRSGKLDGLQCEIVDPNGEDPVARATVWRNDMTHPIVAEVYWSEYGKDAKNPLWRTKPRTMLRKTAEVHALRRAFALSGLYTEEEMDHVPREAPDTSRPVASAINEAPIRLNPPTPAPRDADAGPVLKCDVCGRSNADYPALPIRERDGRQVCGPCQRKAEKEMHVPSPAEPAPAPVKAVPKPPAKVPAPSGEAVAVCEECGAPVTDAQRKTSMLFVTRCLCSRCIDTTTTGPQPGEQGFAS